MGAQVIAELKSISSYHHSTKPATDGTRHFCERVHVLQRSGSGIFWLFGGEIGKCN